MHKAESLRGQDVLVACKLFALMVKRTEWSFPGLSAELDISVGEIYNAVGRCRRAQLLTQSDRVSRPHLRELLASAVPRVFYAVRGAATTGVPTSKWAPPLSHLSGHLAGSPIVWPGDGDVRGESVFPIYSSVPRAALRDPVVYELLALVDLARVGDTSEQKLAASLIEKRVMGR